MTTDNVKSAIQNNFPEFNITNVQFIGEGFDNIAFEVNDDYIFRFTKSAVSSGFGGSLEIEHCLLPKLQPHLSIPIPNFQFYGKQSNNLPFVGYKKIDGTELSLDLLNKLSLEHIDTIFKTISTFFNELHSFPITIAQDCGVQLTNFKERYDQDGIDVTSLVSPLLTTQENNIVESWLHEYITNYDNFTYTPSFIHADLWLSHILINKENNVEGIIDFSDMTIGDPDYDYMQICQEYEPAYQYFEKYVSGFNTKRVKRKTEFFRRWNVVQDLIIFVNRKDEENIEETLATLRTLL